MKFDKLCMWIAWHLPKRVVMWAYYRIAAFATQGEWGNEHPDDVTIMTAVDRWMKHYQL